MVSITYVALTSRPFVILSQQDRHTLRWLLPSFGTTISFFRHLAQNEKPQLGQPTCTNKMKLGVDYRF